jgi:uncharacterized repeat protein (TIGR01451 family)
MNRLVALAAVLLAAAPAAADEPLLLKPPRSPSPLLYVRFLGEPGMRVTFYRGDQGGPREYEVPVTVGLRPGYVYRLRVRGIPDRPDFALYPTLEVRGTLCLPPRVNPADHPAPVAFSEMDLQRVLDGVFLSKVIYLEHPDKAPATLGRPDQAAETNVPAEHDLLDSAREFGRPMLVLRLGTRVVDDRELHAQGVPGTILLPAEKTLLPPKVPPCLPWHGVNVYDPFLGPKHAEEECLHDGGDVGRIAGIVDGGRVGGLDPSDTVAEYTDSRGQRRLTCSNRVCLCVPRYAALRTEVPLAGYESRTGPADAQLVQRRVELEKRLPPREAHLYAQPGAFRGRHRPTVVVAERGVGELTRLEVLDAFHVYLGPAEALGTPAVVTLTEVQRTRLIKQMEFARSFRQVEGPGVYEQMKGPAVVGQVEGLGLVTATVETRDFTAICGEPPQVFADRPMHLYKWCDRECAKIGDVVTFYLKYHNNGGKPIDDVAVSDSLTARLEYVPGSAKSDRPAVFTMQENEAGSVILRWEVNGRLRPNESGTVSFQARVR